MKTDQARSKLPPTARQLERVNELIEHEAITPHLDSVLRNFEGKIRTRGGTGVLLQWLKKEIEKWEKTRTP